MAWAVRKIQEDGRLAVVDVVYGPKPEGENVVRAEFLLRKPAGALFIKRALVAGVLDVGEADQVAVAIRAMQTVSGTKDSKAEKNEFRKLLFGIAKDVSAPINTKWSYALNESHHGIATRMMNYYRAAVQDVKNPPSFGEAQ